MTTSIDPDQAPVFTKTEALELFIKELEIRAGRIGITIDRHRMIGRKRDFIAAAKKWSPILESLGESSFEEYMRKVGCKFPSSGVSKNDRVISRLFANENSDRLV